MPYKVGTEQFHELFFLVDGIYPSYSSFVKGITQPLINDQKIYTAWQEAKRKDIERVFGVAKCTWQFLARPIHVMGMEHILKQTHTCLILHNMLLPMAGWTETPPKI